MERVNPIETVVDSESEPELLSNEHSALTREQYNALQKSSYLKMSQEDADAYDKRRVRIGEICHLLGAIRSK